MTRRSEELRKRDRRVLAWSLVVAALVHVAVFVVAPAFRVEPLVGADVELDTTGVAAGGNANVDLLFGPPLVRVEDGEDWTAPPERVLSAQRGVRLETRCLDLASQGRTPRAGRVGLRIRASGRVDVLGLLEGTGDPCADRILTEVAGDLWYHWLPDERFAAPVTVEQPVTVVSATLIAF